MTGSGKEQAQPGGEAAPAGNLVLDQFGRNLTVLAAQNKLDPVIGREKEIERVMQVLSRRTKNNPVLIGEPGVGKTAVVEGLAQSIIANTVPDMLKGKQVHTPGPGRPGGRFPLPRRFRGASEKSGEGGPQPRRHHPLHRRTAHPGGGRSGRGSHRRCFHPQPALARGELQTVGATTLDEYRKHLERDAALERRSSPSWWRSPPWLIPLIS